LLIRRGSECEEALPTCPLCGVALTRRNCKWRVFPGICLNCAPPGVCGALPGGVYTQADDAMRYGRAHGHASLHSGAGRLGRKGG